eukprot:gene16513-18164_t
MPQQFYLVIRRSAPLHRVLRLWQRQALLTSPLYKLIVKFTGEDGIGSGAISKDFLSAAIKSISTEMFPDGSAKVSIFNIQNGNFRSCGELSAVSLAQGEHPPCFLSKCSYESLYKEPDLMSMKDSELTTNEINIVNGVRANCKDFEDLIKENDYTGPIREDHAEEIANSLKVNFVSKRIMCMKEFGKGLDVYGINAMISSNPSV